ncbi:hypothetical protein BC834DRAFT_974515 [Gloeopeniophorella convolvens]|nr:hypothetical protein BC834DRAFT_974515 [Gloeopeniophorella convolvens]
MSGDLPFSLQDFVDGVRWTIANGSVLLLLVLALKYALPPTGVVRAEGDSFDSAGRPQRFKVTWGALNYRGVVDEELPPPGEQPGEDGGAGGGDQQRRGGSVERDDGEANERDEVDAQL